MPINIFNIGRNILDFSKISVQVWYVKSKTELDI